MRGGCDKATHLRLPKDGGGENSEQQAVVCATERHWPAFFCMDSCSHFKDLDRAGCPWFMPVILAIWEADQEDQGLRPV
jgi:hypothetical protein